MGADGGWISEKDRTLLERRFVVDDPAAEYDLQPFIPDGTTADQIVARYDLPKDGPIVICAHCRRQRHRKGYVLALPNGKYALLAARHCGREAFGVSWDTLVQRFDAAEERQRDLKRIEAGRPVFAAALEELRDFPDSEAAEAYAKYVDGLRRWFGPMGQLLAKTVRENGALAVTEHVPDRDEMERVALRDRPDLFEALDKATTEEARKIAKRRIDKWFANEGLITKEIQVPLGACAGDELLSAESPASRIARCAELFAEVGMGVASDATQTQIREHFRNLHRIAEEVRSALALFESLERFCDVTNLIAVAAWAKRETEVQCRIEVRGRALVNIDSGQALQLPVTFERPVLASFQRFALAAGI